MGRRRKPSPLRRRGTALALILIALWAGGAFFHYATSPVNGPVGATIVDIPTGSGFLRITELLHEAGFVENRPFFWVLALVKQASRHIRAGEYEFTGAISPSQILDKLVRGEIKFYPVTLPEDITVKEVATRLAAERLIDEKEFMTLATDRSFLASLGIEGNSFEGYLFPNTYKFDRSMTTREIIRVLVRQFWTEITPEMKRRAKALGFTVDGWVTLASIIGKESGNKDEKGLISAVFHNRLRRGMRLQSDPTAVYRLAPAGNPVKAVRWEHVRQKTPYNTYRIDGLPPGPIANPGIDSLRAALHPAPAPYLYFVAKNDGAHHFSTNLVDHNRAVLKYQIHKQ